MKYEIGSRNVNLIRIQWQHKAVRATAKHSGTKRLIKISPVIFFPLWKIMKKEIKNDMFLIFTCHKFVINSGCWMKNYNIVFLAFLLKCRWDLLVHVVQTWRVCNCTSRWHCHHMWSWNVGKLLFLISHRWLWSYWESGFSVWESMQSLTRLSQFSFPSPAQAVLMRLMDTVEQTWRKGKRLVHNLRLDKHWLFKYT